MRGEGVLGRPFRARGWKGGGDPGRCPGLAWGAPSGLGIGEGGRGKSGFQISDLKFQSGERRGDRAPLQASGLGGGGIPGRCPGLTWGAPLRLQTAAEGQVDATTSTVTSSKASASAWKAWTASSSAAAKASAPRAWFAWTKSTRRVMPKASPAGLSASVTPSV